MEAGDIDEVLEIERESFPKPWTRPMFEGELKNPVSFSYTLKLRPREGVVEIGGYCVLWVVHGEGHILNIAVNPKYRGKGVATRLLSLMLALMKRNMVYEVFLEVRVSNEVARGLYRKFGFRESFVRKNYYGDEDAIVMVLDL